MYLVLMVYIIHDDKSRLSQQLLSLQLLSLQVQVEIVQYSFAALQGQQI